MKKLISKTYIIAFLGLAIITLAASKINSASANGPTLSGGDILGAKNAGIDQIFFNIDNISHNEEITHEIDSLIKIIE